MIPLLLIGFMVALIVGGLIVGVSAGIAAIIGGSILFGGPLSEQVPMMISRFSIDRINSFLLLTIPFFILAGRLMNSGGVTERLFEFVSTISRPLRGGLGHANVMASFIFAGMSGSGAADVAGLGAVEMKAMRSRGYPDGFSAGVTAGTTLLSPILPPSVVLIAYAVQAGQSVATMFLAAIIPGILLAFSFILWVTFMAYRSGLPRGSFPKFSEVKETGYKAIFPMLTPAIILMGIYLGVFTPTEAAAVAVVYAFILAKFIYKELSWKDFYEQIVGTMLDTASLLLIVAMTATFGVIMLRLGLPQALTSYVSSLSNNPDLILILMMSICLAVGCFMSQTPAIIILTPILLPIAQSYNIDLVHFGMVMALSLTIGLITPPVGIVLYALQKISMIDIRTLFRVTLPYMIITVGVVLLLIMNPYLVTWLPNSLGYY